MNVGYDEVGKNFVVIKEFGIDNGFKVGDEIKVTSVYFSDGLKRYVIEKIITKECVVLDDSCFHRYLCPLEFDIIYDDTKDNNTDNKFIVFKNKVEGLGTRLSIIEYEYNQLRKAIDKLESEINSTEEKDV